MGGMAIFAVSAEIKYMQYLPVIDMQRPYVVVANVPSCFEYNKLSPEGKNGRVIY